MRKLLVSAISLCFCQILYVNPISAAAPEVRAMWVSRFEWPNANQATCKANIDTIMTNIANNHFNTVLFQVRGQCDTLYPSPYEPWTSTFSWTNPGWDPLAYAIQSAHSRGLEFHAYINTHTLAGPVPPANTTPQHMYNLHGPGVAPAQSWMIRTSPTAPAGAVDSYYWTSPGIPEASWWTRRAVLDVVKRYNVDGVHFDRIRCPANTYSHDPISEARFTGAGNPDSLAWADFMRSQITRDLRNIYGEIQYYKPNVKVSAAPFGIVKKDGTTHYQGTGTQSYSEWFQDSWTWMSSHVVDFMVPQIYWEMGVYGSAHPFELLHQDWMDHLGGRSLVAGSTTGDGTKIVSHLIAEQQETRNQGGSGHCVFSVGSMGAYWSAFSTGPYTENASIPTMPWKTSPTTGFICGYVKDAAGNPILDAVVQRTGDSYKYLSAYDGFFAILDVPPGSHTLTPSKSGLMPVSTPSVSVTAGQVTSVTLILTSDTPTISVTPPSLSLSALSGGSLTIPLTISNNAAAGRPNLEWTMSNPTISENDGDIVGTVAGGTNRYRGNVYSATQTTILTGIQSYLSISGTVSLHFVVCESSSYDGTYTKIAEQTVSRTGSGFAYYASNSMNVVLQSGKYYIIAAGWGGSTVGYGYDSAVGFPHAVSFGQTQTGFGPSGYPIGATTTRGASSVNTYPVILTTAAPWLTFSLGSGSVAPGESQTVNVSANPSGLPRIAFNGTLNISSNDTAHSPTLVPVVFDVPVKMSRWSLE